jgi:hypothetical protein
MSDPREATIGNKKPKGTDDAEGWTHGGIDTLRDPAGGTYGTLPGQERPEQVTEPRIPDDPQQGADVRHEAEPLKTTLPAGLVQRKGPYSKTSGRRSENKP